MEQARRSGYWPMGFFSFCFFRGFIDRNEVEVHKHARRERAWPIKDLLHGIKSKLFSQDITSN